MKIVKGDTVTIIAGKDKGRQGEVVQAFPATSRILVKGLNMFKKHIKPNQNQKGGIIEKERSLPVSSAMLLCPSCKKNTRVGYLVDRQGGKNRICKLCQSLLPTKLK